MAATILGKSEQFVRRGLIAGKLHFGTAVEGAGGRYSYHISPKLFMDYTVCTIKDIERSNSDCQN